MKRIISNSASTLGYHDRFLNKRNDFRMIALAKSITDKLKSSQDVHEIVEFLYDNRKEWMRILMRNFQKPDCCRYSAFISLMLDNFNISDYSVYEGFATPPSTQLVGTKNMLTSDRPIINHVWLICKDYLFESFNSVVNVDGHNPAAQIYPKYVQLHTKK